MGHGTLVSGVQRLVTAGLDLVDGVQRKQKKGLTLVGGVQRDVSFLAGTAVMTIGKSAWNEYEGNVVVGNASETKYYAAGTSVEFEIGTEIHFWLSGGNAKAPSYIQVDGVKVATASGSEAVSYSYKPKSNINVNFETWGMPMYIDITTT